MKIALIIAVLIIAFLAYLVISGGKQAKEYQANLKILTVENYRLIRDSPHADSLSKYKIVRAENKVSFTTKDGYTLFWIEKNKEELYGVKLRGLDGYGIRDREFLKYTANLIREMIDGQ